MSDEAGLQKKTAEALQRYREALNTVETLEQEEAAAHQAVTEVRSHCEIAIGDHTSCLERRVLFQAGQVAFSRLSEIRHALHEAIATLDLTYYALDAVDCAQASGVSRPARNSGHNLTL